MYPEWKVGSSVRKLWRQSFIGRWFRVGKCMNINCRLFDCPELCDWVTPWLCWLGMLVRCVMEFLMGPLGVPVKIISIIYVSRLILRPNLAYNSTFNCDISSLIVLSFSSTSVTSSSMFSVDFVSSSWTSGSGSEINESPIL